jgi:hypothetical protein
MNSPTLELTPQPPATQHLVTWKRRVKNIQWTLVFVLGVQAWLSGRLISSNTAFVDEATYLFAGHQELHSILANGSVTVPGQNGYYQSYFSGAPIFYPILGAIADSIDGLTAARILSLLFMLGATTFLYCTTSRLYGRRAAILASAVFAILASTEFLGAFATYDAMALCTMALAAFLAVKSAQQDDNKLTLFSACAAMIAADSVKYAVIIFNPVIIGMCVLVSAPDRGWAQARRQGYRMLGYSATMAAALLAVGGHTYVEGLMSTTITRAQGSDSAHAVLSESWHLIGGVAVVAVAAVILHFVQNRQSLKWLSVLLAAAVALVPLDQAHIHTLTSLQKHVDFGAWFAAITAGYLLSKAFPETRTRAIGGLTLLAASVALAAVGLVSAGQAAKLYGGWSSSAANVAALAPWAENVNVLAEDYFIYSYYLGSEVPLNRWANTWHLSYEDPSTRRELTGAPAYQDAIMHRYFGTIALSDGSTTATDQVIIAAMKRAGGYDRVAHVRYGRHWFDIYHDARAR